VNAYWIAIYEDGSMLLQFDNGKENLFKDIDLDRLVEFQLVFNSKKVLSVYPKLGAFNINGFSYTTDIAYKRNNSTYKLIYYRRVFNQIEDGVSSKIFYNIGFEVNINGVVHKRILSSDGYDITLISND